MTTDIATTDDFGKALEVEKKNRKLLTDYIKSELKEGTDYGKIVGNKNNLLKPGAEKFLSLMSFTAKFEKDSDTWGMLGSKEGTVAYVCKIETKSGKFVGEGRGVCTVAERQSNPNTAVKIAEKRALVDAVLRTFSLSDAFTQDQEDPVQVKTGVAAPPVDNAKPALDSQGDPNKADVPLTDPQRNLIFKLFEERNVPIDIQESIRKDIREGLVSKSDASKIIDDFNNYQRND